MLVHNHGGRGGTDTNDEDRDDEKPYKVRFTSHVDFVSTKLDQNNKHDDYYVEQASNYQVEVRTFECAIEISFSREAVGAKKD